MKFNSRLFVTAIFLCTTGAVAAAVPAFIGDEPLPSLAPLVQRVEPAVVNIRVSQTVRQNSPFGDDAFRRFFGIPDGAGGSREVASAGSGVIVDARRGYILTNHHVVENADEIQVSLMSGKILEAEVVGSDAATDIAVIKVEAEGLTEMPIGDSEALRVGDFVLAIGNPFGLGHTVTSGIVSALGRTGINSEGYEDFIQTDASINPGNSGGALVNMRGELVGINSAIISRTGGNVGIGFAVPTSIASSIMRQLLDFGEVRRGLLGVSIQTIDSEVAKALEIDVDSGALISMVEPGSAAEEAGLKVDDIIVEVNKEKISGAAELRNAIGLRGSGEKVSIKYVRGKETHTTMATLRQQPVASASPRVGADIYPGLAGAEFAASSTTGTGGIEVTSVVPDSPAAQRGLQAGDIITAANRREVRNLEELAAVANASSRLFLLVQRGDRVILLQIR